MNDAGAEAPSVVLRSPAKINLGLRIVGRRTDGYHEIRSLFSPISLFDEIVLSPSIDGKTSVTYVTQKGSPLHFQNDTVSRVLEVLSETGLGITPLHIKITKLIPHGAGLGGGSSNAGIVLKFLYERLAPTAENTGGGQVLIRLASQIGADVPFFVGRGPALVSGIGEQITGVKTEPFAVVVAVPPFPVNTRQAYLWFDQECELTRPDADATTKMVQEAEASGTSGSYPRVINLREIIEILKNDLEKPVEARHPEIGILKEALRTRGALGTLMSGTGSSVYGVYRSLSEAITAREKLQLHFPSSYAFFSCETLN